MKLVSILSLACVLAAAGCSSTSDTGTDGGTGGDTGTGGGDTGTGGGDTGTVQDTGTSGETGGSCTDCTAAHCSAENAACAADSKCLAGIACLQGCQTGDAGGDVKTCENTCITNADNSNLNAFVACAQTNCSSQCGL
jgi:hypothetical protein